MTAFDGARSWRRLAAALFALGSVVSGCATVPTSSQPQVVQSLPVDVNEPRPAITPAADADPRSIVLGFLQANALTDPPHTAARSFLTREAKNRWSDDTITVVYQPVVGNVDAKDRITVSGQETGTVDANGVYTPSLPGDGSGAGGVPVSLTLALARIGGQWRISSLSNGLIVSAADFETQAFQQRVVYFFDAAGDRLVPDPRWTQLTGGSPLANWLMGLLAAGPRGGLQTVLPGQTDPKRTTVTLRGGLAIVQVPGAGQLGSGSRDRLAAQIGSTLAQVPQVTQVEILDGARPVRIPQADAPIFGAAQVAEPFEAAPAPSGLYYVRGGGVYDEVGKPLAGKVGAGAYHLSSVALASQPGTSTLSVAGTQGVPGRQTLFIGNDMWLRRTPLSGRLSRPAWDPTHQEVWIGDNAQLERVSRAGKVWPVRVTAAGGSATGRVTAVRLSPEGSRVALVLTNPDGTAQLWVGAIVRTPQAVRVDGLTPISPQGISVTDAAWNDALKLFTIGRDLRTGVYGVYEVQSDGSRWTVRNTVGLPQAPDSITVAPGEVAAVSAGGTVWKQRAGYWVSLSRAQTAGTNPIYVE